VATVPLNDMSSVATTVMPCGMMVTSVRAGGEHGEAVEWDRAENQSRF